MPQKLFRTVVLLFILLAAATRASAAESSLSTFDIYVAPYIAPQYGSYKADSIDSGSVATIQFGARLGFKLGPLLLGGEFGAGYSMNNSTQAGVSTGNQQKYLSGGVGEMISLGVHAGITAGRWLLLGTYFPSTSFNASSRDSGTEVKAEYEGKAYAAELNFKVSDKLYIGVYAMSREYDQFTSGALSNATLDPAWKSMTYGLNICSFVSFSDLAKIPALFKKI